MEKKPETEYAKDLYMRGYLPGPEICNCSSKSFEIQNFTANKTHECCFTCLNYKLRKAYPIETNSFFVKFSYVPLRLVSEIIKCFIIKDINADKTWKNLVDENNITISKQLIFRIFQEIEK